jgi:hypothetical protein
MNKHVKRTAVGIGTLFTLFLLLGALVGGISWADAAEGAALLFAIGMGMLIIGRIRRQIQQSKEKEAIRADADNRERFGLDVGLAMTLGIGVEALVALISDEYIFRGYGIGLGMMMLGVLTLLGRVVKSDS